MGEPDPPPSSPGCLSSLIPWGIPGYAGVSAAMGLPPAPFTSGYNDEVAATLPREQHL
jgi:hypothetical protein